VRRAVAEPEPPKASPIGRLVKPLALATLLAGGCAHVPTSPALPPARDEDLVRADAAFAADVAARRLDAWVEHFAPDGVMLPAGVAPTRGQAAIRELMAPLFADPGFKIAWTPTEGHVGGTVGWTSGTSTITSARGVRHGKYMTVWRRLPDGQWRIAADIGNTDP